MKIHEITESKRESLVANPPSYNDLGKWVNNVLTMFYKKNNITRHALLVTDEESWHTALDLRKDAQINRDRSSTPDMILNLVPSGLFRPASLALSDDHFEYIKIEEVEEKVKAIFADKEVRQFAVNSLVEILKKSDYQIVDIESDGHTWMTFFLHAQRMRTAKIEKPEFLYHAARNKEQRRHPEKWIATPFRSKGQTL